MAVAVIAFILRVPSFFEPYSYGDEMIYLTLGQGIRQGAKLYSELHDNKPPLLYLVAAVAGNLFWFKVILAVWNLLTIVAFWKLLTFLFPKNKKLQVTSTVAFFLLTTLPLLEGNIANAEMFMIGTTITAFYTIFTKPSSRHIFISGILLSISFLFKVPAVFEIPVVLFFWLLKTEKLDRKNIILLLKNSAILLLGFAIPIIVTLVWSYSQGSISDYISAAFTQNIGYVSSWRAPGLQTTFLERNKPLLIRSLIALAIVAATLLKRRIMSQQFAFSLVWLVLTLFAATLSERPYPHYLIQSVGPLSIFIGMVLSAKNFDQALAIFPLTLFLAVPAYYHFWYYKTLPYYQRFLGFATGKITTEDYLLSFGKYIPAIYKTSKYIATTTSAKDRIFVWGDTSTIYALSGRLPPIKYVADYHIKDFSSIDKTEKEIKDKKPALIILFPDVDTPFEISSLVLRRYHLLREFDGIKVYKLNPQKE